MRATVEIDGPAVMGRIHKVIVEGRRFYEELLERNGALWVRGEGRFRDGALVVREPDGETVVRDVPIVLAVGARPWIAPIPGLETASFLTSDDLLQLTDLPRSLAIGGAGPIAVEFAQALNRLGVEVTLVLRSDSPLRGEEPEARETILRVLRRRRRPRRHRRQPHQYARRAGRPQVSWLGGSVTAEKVLIATGREPRSTSPTRQRRASRCSTAARGSTRTSRRRHAACGRSATRSAATTAASSSRTSRPTRVRRWRRTRCAARTTSRYLGMPRVTFTDPEVAAVGLTEAEARERGIDAHSQVKLVREVGKARAVGESEGFVKVVIDRASGKLVGATIMAAHAGDMLATLTMPLHTRSGDLGPLLHTTFAHPTLSEAIKVAVRDAVAAAPAPEAEMTT